jgi:hypothetical protein
MSSQKDRKQDQQASGLQEREERRTIDDILLLFGNRALQLAHPGRP